MATPEASGSLKLKLQIVVDKKKNRVVFADAKKDFVDFIFHILSLPLGAVHRILANAKNTSTTSLGSIGTLLDGLKNLDDEYIEDRGKYYLLGIKAPYWGQNTTLVLPEATCPSYNQVFHGLSVGTQYDRFCYNEKIYSAANQERKGYVKEVAKFMVMDDLVVRPAEPASVFSLMNQHSIKDIDAIEKMEVTFGTAQAIKLLKASISSNTVLTDVFLGGAVKAEI